MTKRELKKMKSLINYVKRKPTREAFLNLSDEKVTLRIFNESKHIAKGFITIDWEIFYTETKP